MAEEILVKEVLTKEMIENGKWLIENLDRRAFPVEAALWLYTTDENRWRLVLATHEIALQGPIKVYGQIQKVLHDAGPHGVPFMALRAVDTREPLIKDLREAVPRYGVPIGVRTGRDRVGDQFIEDAYIYRIAA